MDKLTAQLKQAGDSNIFKLFNTVLPHEVEYDSDDHPYNINHFIDVTPGIRITLEEETSTIYLNGAYVAGLDEELAGELLTIVRKMGYTENYADREHNLMEITVEELTEDWI